MSLELERKSLGVKHLLRKLRGTSPRPLSPEDQVQSLFSEGEGGIQEAEKEGPAALGGTADSSGGSPLLKGLRGRGRSGGI
jgi:hypothetical protein